MGGRMYHQSCTQKLNTQRLAHSVSRFLCRFRSMVELLICNQRTRVRFLQAAPHRQHVRQINLIAKHGSPSMGRKDYHMALKRADIRTILENPETSNDDKAKAILDALHKETDELKDQLDAEKQPAHRQRRTGTQPTAASRPRKRR